MSTTSPEALTRRDFLVSSLLAGAAIGAGPQPARATARSREPGRALVAITLDLEMSRHYPSWDQTEWDYEKGNLDGPTKAYAVEAARRVKERGGVVHCFGLGRTMEQPDVSWLKGILDQGHPIGNHTYDHVNVKATTIENVQFRFRRSPWLAASRRPEELILDNIALGEHALRERLGTPPRGFRTPGGFANGLADRPGLQRFLLDRGQTWVSSLYPRHPTGPATGGRPTEATFDAIQKAQEAAQPFAYVSGLIEVPMSPVSDVTAMRAARWPLEDFLEATRRGVSWAIDRGAVFDFLAHPSCLCVTDPEFRAIDLICDLVENSRGRAAIVDLDTIAASIEAGR